MRLIDADKFLDFIREIGKESEDYYGNTRRLISIDLKRVEELIEKQPTAYDVNKVVEQISEISELARPAGWLGKEEIVRTKEAIGIVKRRSK